MTLDFNRAWAENTTIQEWTDAQYKAGWAAVGDTPPTVEQFDAVLNALDKKANANASKKVDKTAVSNAVDSDSEKTVASSKAVKDLGDALTSTVYSATRRYRSGEIVFICDDEAQPTVGNWYECYFPDGSIGKDPRDPANRPDGWTSSDPSKPYYWLKLGKVFTPSCPGMLETWETTTLPQNRIKALPAPLNATKFWRLALARPDNVNNGQIIFPDDVRGQGLNYWDDTGLVDEAGRQLNSLQGDAIRNITGRTATGIIARPYDTGEFWHGAMKIRSSAGIGGKMGTTGHSTYIDFDASKVVPTAARNRIASTSKLAVRCI